MGSILRLDILSVDGTIIWEEMEELEEEMQTLCQHTDAIVVNTGKAGVVVGKTGGRGRLEKEFITVVF